MGRKQLRPSQYVTTYGSGSLIGLPIGHVVIPTVTKIVCDLKKIKSFVEPNEEGKSGLDKFSIEDQKMEKILLNKISKSNKIQIKIFRLPTNADLQEPEKKPLFTANPFPRYSVCYNHSDTPILARLEQKQNGLGIRCPFCINEDKDPGRGIPVRFIQACAEGHMDDIDWSREVHYGKECRGNIFLWQETGSSSNFTVICYGHFDKSGFHKSDCRRSVSYFDLKRKSENNMLECNGMLQEGKQETCIKNPKMILKNASNLRIPEVISSVYIPKYPGQLYNSLRKHGQLLDSFYQENYTKEKFQKFFEDRIERWKISLDVIRDIDDAPIEEIKEAVNNIIDEISSEDQNQSGMDFEDAINTEFESLLKASIEGFPPQKMGIPTGFHVEHTDSITFYSKEFDLYFRITPIRQLFVTKVQIGYSREVISRKEEEEELQINMRRKGRIVYNYHDEGDIGSKIRWFIGNQLQGEGLFIQVCDSKDEDKHVDPLSGKDSSAIKSWKDLFSKQKEREEKRKTNPRFVWWHSLSHKIINQLSIDSGFASTSISERVYCRWNSSKKIFESGILLYTAQTGGDGTLGGLTSLTKQFPRIFQNIAADVNTCSNDPVCYGRKRTKHRLNGAVCHACLLVSETSCELFNKFLDRNILIETMKNE